MQYDLVASDNQLAQLCGVMAAARTVAFDTEFISERSYRTQLCLVQVAADEHLAVIDPLQIADMTPFWRQLAEGQQRTIVHAGREELGFSLRAVGRPPANLVDVQICAGLVSTEYPAGYSALLSKLLGRKLHKHETRSDWSIRPLSPKQIQYALDDVRYLPPMWDRIQERLRSLGREDWVAGEIADWQREVETASTAERWRRVSGVTNLSARSLAAVRELWRWRETEAERRNSPPRRVLRDDLIVEMARQLSSDVKQIQLVRGLDRGDYRRFLPQLAACIQRANELPADQLPTNDRPDIPSQLNLVAQLLASILTSLCRQREVAVALVGTVQDVRELIAYRLGLNRRNAAPPPRLAQGWRAEIVGKTIEDLLAGEACIRVADPLSDDPLAIEPRSS